jgi:hypothetical protein
MVPSTGLSFVPFFIWSTNLPCESVVVVSPEPDAARSGGLDCTAPDFHLIAALRRCTQREAREDQAHAGGPNLLHHLFLPPVDDAHPLRHPANRGMPLLTTNPGKSPRVTDHACAADSHLFRYFFEMLFSALVAGIHRM